MDVIYEVYEASPTSMEDLERMSLYTVLITMGGYIAMGLGFTHFLVSMVTYANAIFVFQFLVNLSFGFALLICNMNMGSDSRRWTLLAGVFALVLMALGGAVGAISGLIALIGAVLGFLGVE